jgi:hypothetical protein
MKRNKAVDSDLQALLRDLPGLLVDPTEPLPDMSRSASEEIPESEFFFDIDSYPDPIIRPVEWKSKLQRMQQPIAFDPVFRPPPPTIWGKVRIDPFDDGGFIPPHFRATHPWLPALVAERRREKLRQRLAREEEDEEAFGQWIFSPASWTRRFYS